jgi:N-acetylneuraminic acid mutarotase
VHARQGAAAASLGDYIYIFGGSGGSAPIYQAERLDVRTGEVQLLTPHFLPRRFHSVVEHQGRFLLLGGQGYALPGGVLEDTIEVYDPGTNTVERIGRMPDPRQNAAVVRLDGDVLVIGGGRRRPNGSYTQTNDVQVMDLNTGRWRTGPTMPTPRESTAAVVGRFVIVPGGYASRNSLKTVEMYVPEEKAWKRLPDLEYPASAHATALLGRWLFLFGDFNVSEQVLAYELPSRRTQRIKPGFIEARRCTALTHGDRIYVIGGSARHSMNPAGTERDLIQVFTLNPDRVSP